MQRAEQACGTALFERVGRQNMPTPAALLAAQRAGEIQTQMSRLLQASPQRVGAQVPGLDGPVLRAGMAPAAALLYSSTIVRQWTAHEADGQVQIVGGSAPELVAALRDKALDLIISPRPRQYRAASIRSCVLHMSEPAIYLRDGHPMAGATSLEEISSVGWAVAGRAGTPGNVIEEAHRVRRIRPPRIVVQCADYPALLNLVATTDLMCVVPHPSIAPRAQELSIGPLSIRDGLPRYEVCLYWLAERHLRYPSQTLSIVAALKELVSALPAPLDTGAGPATLG
jgi:LysR family transcriptional regulator of abg operon